jgi:hypothetical protein
MIKFGRNTGRIAAAMLAASFALPSTALAANVTLTVPLRGEVDAIIDWGTSDANARCPRRVTEPGDVSCTYDAAIDGTGPFPVRIGGTVSQFGGGETAWPNADKLLRVTSWGDVGLTSLSGAFNGAQNLAQVPTDFPESVTDISHLFRGAINFNQDLSSWGMKVRNVTAMDRAFEDALAFDATLEGWCVRNIRNPGPSFREAFRGRGQTGLSLGAAMKLTPEREPRWGNCGVSIAGGAAAPGEVGTAYTLDVKAATSLWPNAPEGANRENLIFSVVSGQLPPGLDLDGATGAISGTPTETGTFTFGIRAVQPVPGDQNSSSGG